MELPPNFFSRKLSYTLCDFLAKLLMIKINGLGNVHVHVHVHVRMHSTSPPN